MSAIEPIDSLSPSSSRMSMLQMYQDSLYANSQPASATNTVSPMMLTMVQQLIQMLLQQLLQSLLSQQQGGAGNGPMGGNGGGGVTSGGGFNPAGGGAPGGGGFNPAAGGGGGGGGFKPAAQPVGPSNNTRDLGFTPPSAHEPSPWTDSNRPKIQAPETPHKPTHTTQPPAPQPAPRPVESGSTNNKVDDNASTNKINRTEAVVPASKGEVEVNKPIIVGPGEVYDGKDQLFRAGKGLNGSGSAEGQDPMFIVAPGGTIKNVQIDSRGQDGKLYGDGIHLMGDAKVDNVHVRHGGPDDMITIDGPGNRARDAYLAKLDSNSIKTDGPANVEITNSSFHHAHDKVIQVNGDANVKMKNIQADDVNQLLVTMGGKPITAHVEVEDSSLKGVRSHTVRLDSRNSSVEFKNVDTDSGQVQVMAGDPGKVSGATKVVASTDPA